MPQRPKSLLQDSGTKQKTWKNESEEYPETEFEKKGKKVEEFERTRQVG